MQDLRTPLAYVSHVRRVADGKFVFLGRTDTSSQTLWGMSIKPRTSGAASDELECELRAIVHLDYMDVPSEYISLPTAYTLEHPTTGEPIHAIYWPPTNPEYAGGLPGELPPVVVNIHGGPTHMVWQGLNWETQLFTSRGFGW